MKGIINLMLQLIPSMIFMVYSAQYLSAEQPQIPTSYSGNNLSTPVNFAPVDGAIIVRPTSEISWHKVPNATFYNVQTSKTKSFNEIISNQKVETFLTNITNIPLNTEYYWRVQAGNSTSLSEWSNPWVLTYKQTSETVPILLKPANGVVIQEKLLESDKVIAACWNGVLNATDYEVQIAKSTTFNPLLVTIPLSAYYTYTSFFGFEPKTVYYWRVGVKVTGSETQKWSSVWSFTFQPEVEGIPDVPLPQSPAAFATNQPLNLKLIWQPSQGALTYNVQLATAPSFEASAMIKDEKNIQGVEYGLNQLKNGQEYYWRVSAQNTKGTSAWCTTSKFTTLNALPKAPILKKPANSSTKQPLSLTLEWQAVPDAESYSVQVSKSSDFSQLIKNELKLVDTNFILSALTPTTTYYWRVQAVNGAGQSDWSGPWSFTTSVEVENVPKLQQPLNNSIEQPLSVALVWAAIGSNASYNLQVSTSAAFDKVLVNASNIAPATYQLNGLSPNSQYYWRVSSTIQSVTSNWSDIWSFKTIAGTTNAPVLIAPANGSIDMPLSLTFSWTASSTPYTFQLGTSADFTPTTLLVSNNTLTGTSMVIPPNNLIKSTKYFWRVGASVSGSSLPQWSTVSSFTTTAKDSQNAPVLMAPANNSTNQPVAIDFTWNPLPNAKSYCFQLSTLSDFPSDKMVSTSSMITNVTFNVKGLQKNTSYFWRVNARDSIGVSGWSQTWTFTTTTVSEGLPVAPELMYPLNNAINIPYSLSIVWKSVQNASSYALQLATSQQFTNESVINDVPTVTATYYNVTDLKPNTIYYWRVRANNSAGAGKWSDPWMFSTTKFTDIQNKNIETMQSECLFFAHPSTAQVPVDSIEFYIKSKHPIIGDILILDYLGRVQFQSKIIRVPVSKELSKCGVWNLRNTQALLVPGGAYRAIVKGFDSKGNRIYSNVSIGIKQ